MVFPTRHKESRVADKWRSTIFFGLFFGCRIVSRSALVLHLHPAGLEPTTL